MIRICAVVVGLLLSCFSLRAQVIEGTYARELPDEGGVNTYKFSGNIFRSFQNIHSDKLIRGGYYIIEQDSLVLVYEPLSDPEPSTFEVLEKQKIEEEWVPSETEGRYASFLFKVQNAEGKLMPGVIMTVLEDMDEPSLASTSNKEGVFPYLNIYDRDYNKIRFSFVGHKPLELNPEDFFGYNSKILIKLSDSKDHYGKEVKIEKYKIAELDKSSFTIVVEEGRKVTFQRQ